MISFMLLVITLIIITVIVALTIGVGGAAFIILFSDVIICIALILWFIHILRKKITKR
jgi:hypothetical protein